MSDLAGSFMSSVLAPFLGSGVTQSLVMALVVKWATDQLKKFLKKVDAEGLPEGYKVPIELMVTICSTLVTIGSLAMQGKLGTFDVASAVNWVVVSLPVALEAMGIHMVAKSVMVKTLGRETLK